MKLAKSVKVGGRVYEIRSWDSLEAQGADRVGQTCHLAQVISIDATQHARRCAEAVLHELLHVIFNVWVIDHLVRDEEHAVEGLTSALGAVWRDNPELFRWLHRRLTR